MLSHICFLADMI